jgi:septal ring factor EnvC (AmiA/AmiB activator)
MNATSEVLHDRAVADPCQWQPIASLSAILGIAERTVRHRVQQGTVERFTTADGRAYYRATPPPVATPMTGNDTGNLPAILAEHLARLDAMTAALVDARTSAASATATTAATLARLDDAAATIAAERTRIAALDAERQALAARLDAVRERTALAERVALAPWYAFRLRRRLRRSLSIPLPGGGNEGVAGRH